ncbi:MAG: hypothetical protein NVS4B3_22320 [Gemmatimonadaceae bacterium]
MDACGGVNMSAATISKLHKFVAKSMKRPSENANFIERERGGLEVQSAARSVREYIRENPVLSTPKGSLQEVSTIHSSVSRQQ